ncbi:RxLR effector protein [Phytophthora megakarya]|uniref:RxLR effector protein n=1 Tax=Phytophthora megakarya TaxID=4795 RepID=A0A225UHK6_9STRA|nr:RxLR effector protein [Phytophthora megakarya]
MRFTYVLLVATGILVASIGDFVDAKNDTPTVKSMEESGVATKRALRSQDYGKPIDQGDSAEERASLRPSMKEVLKNFWKKPKLFLKRWGEIRHLHG